MILHQFHLFSVHFPEFFLSFLFSGIDNSSTIFTIRMKKNLYHFASFHSVFKYENILHHFYCEKMKLWQMENLELKWRLRINYDGKGNGEYFIHNFYFSGFNLLDLHIIFIKIMFLYILYFPPYPRTMCARIFLPLAILSTVIPPPPSHLEMSTKIGAGCSIHIPISP
jgi:hypothetical protein